MKLSLPAWSLPSLTLPEVRGVARSLGFDGIDVGLFYASALDKQRVLTEPEALGKELVAAGVPVANYYHLFGDDLADSNLAMPEAREANLQQLRNVVTFCQTAGIPTLFVLPGMLNLGQTLAEARKASAVALREGVAIAADAGVQLIIEPHVQSHVESPGAVLELLEAAPGLKLALDHSHFVCLGFTQDEIDVLLPHAAHVHLRQARAGRLQERLQYGTLNFNAILSKLVELGFDGWVSPEPLHQDYIDCWQVDVITELVAFRDLVRTWSPSAAE
jgi:sugar phosphate isomerase/epimerase